MKRNKISLIYWSEDNFGDALSPVVIEELSGNLTQLKHAYKSKFRRFVKSIIYFSPKELNTILFPWQENVLGVGSVICCGNSKSKVWGSGFMSNSGDFLGGSVFAVRGPSTSKRLVEQGFDKCEVYGDPALLLPLWEEPVEKKTHQLGIVPHWKESDKFIEEYGDKYKIIDLRTKDIKKIITEITSCEYILSTSLHGIIVAHAYDIPSLWIKRGFIETDGFKFADYFGSVRIPAYTGFEDIENILLSDANWKALFLGNEDKSSISIDLNEIQLGLLKAFPFPLKDKYEQLLNRGKFL